MKWLCLILMLMVSTGCSYRSFVADAAYPIIDGGIDAIFAETDVTFAEAALPAQLLLLDGLINQSPGNTDYLVNGAMGYAAYALGFIEDQDPDRAKVFYQRAKRYGMQVLMLNDSFQKALDGSFEDFTSAVQSFDEDDVPAMFWTAISWGLYINLSLDDPRAMAELGKVEVLMRRVQILQPEYFGGGADLFFGVIECVKPKMLGGSPERGLKHFQTALKLSDNDFLLTKAMMAQYYCAATLDEELFDKWAAEILAAPPAKHRKNNLVHALAKAKIKYLQTQKDELF